MSEKKKALVIFDLDETLIHSRPDPLERDPDYLLERLNVYFRPHATRLISLVARNFEIAVWSAGSPLYVRSIVEKVFPPDVKPLFVWNRDHCTARFELAYFQTLFLKDLNKMKDFGFDLKNILIIEDDPVKVRDFANNAIIVSQYFGQAGDEELSNLARFMETLNHLNHLTEDVRDLGKNWRDKLGLGA